MLCLSSRSVTCVAFKPDNPNIVVSSSYDETIKTWDITSGSWLSTLSVDAGYGGVQSVSFSPSGNMIAAGSYSGIHFMDVAAGQIKSSLKAHSDYVNAVAWSPCGQWLASGGDDKMVYVYDAKTFEVKWPLNVGYAFSRFSTRISVRARPLFSRFSTRISV